MKKSGKKIIQYVESEGFHVVEMCECELNRLCQRDSLYDKLDTKGLIFFWKHDYKKKVTEKLILEGVLSGKLFGFVQWDLRVQERWGKGFENFSGLTPLQIRLKRCPPFFAQVKCHSNLSASM